MATPLLGFKTPKERTQDEHDAHEVALNVARVQFALPRVTLAKGEKILLTGFHQDPRVIKDRGFAFSRMHQWTGSCVWAGGTSALTATISAAACSNNPIKAIMPFTLPNYADSRHRMGSDSKGDGSMGSTFYASLTLMGVSDWNSPVVADIPKYHDRGDDGVDVGTGSNDGSQIEYAYSSIRTPTAAEALKYGKDHLVAPIGECKSTQDVKDFVGNGYGVSFACDRVIGHGSQQSDGTVLGFWDSNGGHQQYIVGIQEHPTLGSLFLAGNNWPRGTYPITPMQPVCFVWVTEAKVASAMQNLDAEVFGIGRPDGFPGQPELLSYVT